LQSDLCIDLTITIGVGINDTCCRQNEHKRYDERMIFFYH
jgi:hypothetical protein